MNDLHKRECVTQVPTTQFWSGIEVDEMSRKPLGFVGGGSRSAQIKWPIVRKEAFAIASTCRWFEYVLRDGYGFIATLEIWHTSFLRMPQVCHLPRWLLRTVYIGIRICGDSRIRWRILPGKGIPGETSRDEIMRSTVKQHVVTMWALSCLIAKR